MAFLFQIQNKIVQPNPETLLISPFKEIWERDKSEGKETALQEFAYIEFMTSNLKSNPYKGLEEESRKEKLIEDLKIFQYIDKDELVNEGIEKMIYFQTDASLSYTLYNSAVRAKEQLENFFNNLNINERNDKGVPVYKPKEITTALLDVERVTTSLHSLKTKVEEELFESTKTKADKKISEFAKLSSLNE